MLRLLHSLKPTSVGAHYDLLLAAARHRPDLGSAYLASCQLSLDPKPGLRWLAGSSLLGTLICVTSGIDFLAFATRYGHPSYNLLRGRAKHHSALAGKRSSSYRPDPISSCRALLTCDFQGCVGAAKTCA